MSWQGDQVGVACGEELPDGRRACLLSLLYHEHSDEYGAASVALSPQEVADLIGALRPFAASRAVEQ